MDAPQSPSWDEVTRATRLGCRPSPEAEREHQHAEPDGAPNDVWCTPSERHSALQDCSLRRLGIIKHLHRPAGMVHVADRLPIPIKQVMIGEGDSSARISSIHIAGAWRCDARHAVAVSRQDPAARSRSLAIGAAEIKERTLDRGPPVCAPRLAEVRLVIVNEREPK